MLELDADKDEAGRSQVIGPCLEDGALAKEALANSPARLLAMGDSGLMRPQVSCLSERTLRSYLSGGHSVDSVQVFRSTFVIDVKLTEHFELSTF